ncbi:MAG: UrcA family protein [Maricaulaceae bacterium]|jgi:UrcA family protein
MSGRISVKSAFGSALAAGLGAFALGSAAPAEDLAEDAIEFEFAFAYQPSAVQTEDGAAEVYRSLTTKARRACERDAIGSYTPTVDQACAAGLVSQVVYEIGAPVLTAVHAASPYYVVEVDDAAVQVAAQ